MESLCAKMRCLLMLQQVVYTVTTEHYMIKLPYYTITSLNYKTHESGYLHLRLASVIGISKVYICLFMYTNNCQNRTRRENETEDMQSELVTNVPTRNFPFDWKNDSI
jgi:hypothetical protein